MAGELQVYAAEQLWRAQVRARLGGAYDAQGNSVALATTATTGFAMVPTCAGVPTGVPADVPGGMAPMVIDTTNGRLYFHDGTAWRNAGP